jgi:hypothetical protein
VQSNLYDIDPNTGQLTLVSGGQTAVTLTNSYIVGNGGGSYPANNGTPPVCNSTTGICVPARMVPPPGYSPLQWLKKKTVGLLCGSSPQGAVESWMETGATKGAFAGAVAGGGAAGVATFGIGGAPGAVLGGFLGGVVGASGGALSGGMAAGACSAAGVYGSGS